MSVESATRPAPRDDPYPHRLRVAWAVFVVGALLLIGWPIACIANWHDVVHSHTRLGYLIGDVGLVTPLCFAAWQGLRTRAPWGPGVLLVAIGAGAYDTVHFVVFLVQEKFLLPGPVWIGIAVVLLAIIGWWAVWEIRRMRGPAAAG